MAWTPAADRGVSASLVGFLPVGRKPVNSRSSHRLLRYPTDSLSSRKGGFLFISLLVFPPRAPTCSLLLPVVIAGAHLRSLFPWLCQEALATKPLTLGGPEKARPEADSRELHLLIEEGGRCFDVHPGDLRDPGSSRLFKQQRTNPLCFSSAGLVAVTWMGNGPSGSLLLVLSSGKGHKLKRLQRISR